MSNSNGYLGPPVDVWAMGAMVFEMLHGRPAFNGVSLPQVEMRIRDATKSLAFEVDSPDAKAFVKACLTASPAQRLDVHAALKHRWLSGVAEATAMGTRRVAGSVPGRTQV